MEVKQTFTLDDGSKKHPPPPPPYLDTRMNIRNLKIWQIIFLAISSIKFVAGLYVAFHFGMILLIYSHKGMISGMPKYVMYSPFIICAAYWLLGAMGMAAGLRKEEPLLRRTLFYCYVPISLFLYCFMPLVYWTAFGPPGTGDGITVGVYAIGILCEIIAYVSGAILFFS